MDDRQVLMGGHCKFLSTPGLPLRSRESRRFKCASTSLENQLLSCVFLWGHVIPNHWFSFSWGLWLKAERSGLNQLDWPGEGRAGTAVESTSLVYLAESHTLLVVKLAVTQWGDGRNAFPLLHLKTSVSHILPGEQQCMTGGLRGPQHAYSAQWGHGILLRSGELII